MEMPKEMKKKILSKFGNLPYRKRGIQINEDLIVAAIEILNNSEGKILPQNARNAVMEQTLDGLDKSIKQKLRTNLRTANIISDVLQEKNIVEVIQIENERTGRLINATRLLKEWTW